MIVKYCVNILMKPCTIAPNKQISIRTYERETEKSLFKNGNRYQKQTAHMRRFDSWDDAVAFVREREQNEIQRLDKRIFNGRMHVHELRNLTPPDVHDEREKGNSE